MKALLLKDLILMRKRSGVMVGAIAIFIFLASVQGGLINTIMATMMPLLLCLTTLAYDQTDGWEAYAAALPFSRKQIVQSKYILAILVIIVSVSLVMAVGMISGRKQMQQAGVDASTQITFGLIFVAINYPLILKFGFEKSRMYYILVTVVLMSIGGALSAIQQDAGLPSFAFILPIVAAICVVASYFISCSIMKTKEFSGS